MSKLRKREQAAIEAVARHFSATGEIGKEDSPDAYVTIAGKQIAVEVTAIKRTTGAKRCGFGSRRMQSRVRGLPFTVHRSQFSGWRQEPTSVVVWERKEGIPVSNSLCPLYYNEKSSNILTRIHALAKTKSFTTRSRRPLRKIIVEA